MFMVLLAFVLQEQSRVRLTGLAPPRIYFLRLLGGFCERALPAAVLDALLVRPSRRTFEAAFAAFELVTLLLAMV